MRKYSDATPLAQNPTEHPARLSPVEHAGQAAIGVFAGGALVILALLAGGVIGFAALPLASGIVVGAASLGFLVLGAGSMAHLALYVAETLSRRDINHDGYVGEPATTFVNPYQGQANAQREAAQEWRKGLLSFVRQCETVGTSGPAWEKRIPRSQYEDYRDTLLKSGFAVWISERNHLQGWKLATDAESIAAQIFDAPHPAPDAR